MVPAVASGPGDVSEESGPVVLRRMSRVGVGIMPVMMGRINRPVIVPLLGAAFALGASTISVVFGIAAVLGIVMFIPAGRIMDARGRAAAAISGVLCLAGAGWLARVLPGVVPSGTGGAPTL